MNRYKVTVIEIVEATDDIGAMEAFCHSYCHNMDGEAKIELLETLEEDD